MNAKKSYFCPKVGQTALVWLNTQLTDGLMGIIDFYTTLFFFFILTLPTWHFLTIHSSFYLILFFLSYLTLCINRLYQLYIWLTSTSHCSSVNWSRKHTQQVYVWVRVCLREARRPYWPSLHHCFLICFIPSVRLSNQLSLCVSVCPCPRPMLQVESFTPVITGEDVGYPATLAFRRTFRLVRLRATCCSLSVSLCACHCRCIAMNDVRLTSLI